MNMDNGDWWMNDYEGSMLRETIDSIEATERSFVDEMYGFSFVPDGR